MKRKIEKMNGELMLKVENVSKEYRLGIIGGTTLREEIQRKIAEIRGLEDPTLKIGENRMNQKGKFMALSKISFSVRSGEAVGIIGHNGAGKSTLLKLITRITAPSSGKIYLNGRVTSMLEVGTGFHPELTGRENIYINGAILGMSKKEIDEKMEEIIDFSECRQFIDTPVKRYSSGMYVKLAFSVAAHLDSEIIIMDEVLAVGDVAFQNKCINKMKDIAASGKTVLYVSHNMATIRNLCTRCIVLNEGKMEYDGEVDEAIFHYVTADFTLNNIVELEDHKRPYTTTELVHLNRFILLEHDTARFQMGDKLEFKLEWYSKKVFHSLKLRIGIFTVSQIAVGICFSEEFSGDKGNNVTKIILDISNLLPGKYCLELIFVEETEDGSLVKHDVISRDVILFEITMNDEKTVFQNANESWGYYELPNAQVL